MDKFIEINNLPLNAQKELLDFYEFLLYKYKYRKRSEQNLKKQEKNYLMELMNNPMVDESFVPYSRKDIYENR